MVMSNGFLIYPNGKYGQNHGSFTSTKYRTIFMFLVQSFWSLSLKRWVHHLNIKNSLVLQHCQAFQAFFSYCDSGKKRIHQIFLLLFTCWHVCEAIRWLKAQGRWTNLFHLSVNWKSIEHCRGNGSIKASILRQLRQAKKRIQRTRLNKVTRQTDEVADIWSANHTLCSRQKDGDNARIFFADRALFHWKISSYRWFQWVE